MFAIEIAKKAIISEPGGAEAQDGSTALGRPGAGNLPLPIEYAFKVDHF